MASRTRVLKAALAHPDDPAVREAGRALAEGRLVIFPTETVYGLGTSAVSREAIAALSRLKDRTPDKPFSLHLAGPEGVEAYTGPLSPLARRLMARAWPGPLTLVVPDRRVPRAEPSGLVEEALYYQGTIGLRCPAHDVGRAVLGAAGVPVAATSANLGGRPPPRCVEEALADLDGRAALAVDAGPTAHARASTVVRLREDDTLEVLREGAVTAHRVARLARTRILLVCTGNLCRSPMAAGLTARMLADRFGCDPDELPSRGIEVASAGTGTAAGCPASRHAVEAMRERGIEIGGHRSQPMTVDALRGADYIWVMTRGHQQDVVQAAPEVAGRVALLDPAGQDVADPIGGDLEAYRACVEHLARSVAQRVAEIV